MSYLRTPKVLYLMALALMVLLTACIHVAAPVATKPSAVTENKTYSQQNDAVSKPLTQAPVEITPALSATDESNKLIKYIGKKVEVTGIVTHIEYTHPRVSPGEKWACLFFNDNGTEGLTTGYTANQSPWDYMPYFRAIVKPENMDKFAKYSRWDSVTESRWVSNGGWNTSGAWASGSNQYYTVQVETRLAGLIGQNITISGTLDVKDSAPVIYLTSPDQIK
jgi:hypothetical protein